MKISTEPNSKASLLSIFGLTSTILFTTAALAQTGYHQDYSRLINSSEVVQSVDDGMFGESVNFYSGKTQFQNTDISIPGNGTLPLSVSRSYRVENRHVTKNRTGAFGDWDIDLPRIEAVFPSASIWSNPSRCSQFGVPDATALSQDWSDASQITSNNNWTSVKGIIGAVYRTTQTLPVIDPATLIDGTTGTTEVIANQSSISSLSEGITELDRTPFVNNTVALRGSNSVRAAYLLFRLNTTGRVNVPISYVIRDLDTSTTNNAKQWVALQYRVGSTGNFINVPEGYVADATNPGATPLVTNVLATLPSNANNRPEIQIRIITTLGVHGSGVGTASEWIGIDDISIGSIPVQAATGNEEEQAEASNFAFSADEYNHGFNLIVPGKTDSMLLKKLSSNSAFPSDINIVNNDYWAIKCLSNQMQLPDNGEAFQALAPDGTKYTFNRLVYRAFPSLTRPTGAVLLGQEINISERGPGIEVAPETLERVEAIMLVTRVEDRFGNWVEYDYNNGSGAAYRSQLLQMRAHDGRVLNFTYYANSLRVSTISDGARNWNYSYDTSGSLTDVNLPDSSKWTINFVALSNASYDYGASASCTTFPTPTGPSQVVGTLTHPSSAKADFTFKLFRHEIASTPATCLQASNGTQFARYNPNAYDTLTPTEKLITGGGISRLWTFVWETGSQTKTTQVLGPNNPTHKHKYVFGNVFDNNEGLLLTEEITGDVTQRTSYTYRSASAGPYPSRFGISSISRGDISKIETIRPLSERDTLRYGATLKETRSVFNKFGNAEQVVRSGSDNKTSTYTFENSESSLKWILQALKSVQTAGKTEVSYTLNGDLMPTHETRFGKLEAEIGYDSFGMISSVKDGASNTTTYSNYYRGVPRLISLPGGASQSATVGGYGQVLSVRDEMQRTTGYDYDGLGRLTSINPSEGASTSISYTKTGEWKQTRTTGSRVITTQYNIFWQPTSINDGGRITTLEYDDRSRVAFRSYPNSASGINYDYNVLNELEEMRADTEVGVATTNYDYSGYKTTITDPRSIVTAITYQMFDSPSRDTPTLITGGEGLNVAISRDAWGKPQSINRNNVTRTFTYDAHERLKNTVNPETGTTVLEYDGANNIRSRTVGGQTVAYVHNERNWLTNINYPGTDEDIVIDYYDDGTVKSKENSLSKIAYSYNDRRLPTLETHTIKPNFGTYVLGYGYDSLGGLERVTYPDSTFVDYAPNKYGEATKAGSFATSVGRHNNGSISSYSFGNGKSRSVTVSVRYLPKTITDSGVIAMAYDYDKNGNPTGVDVGTQDLTLGYDNLNRLTSLSGSLSGSLDYDIQDNLKSTTISGVQTTMTYSGQLLSSIKRGTQTHAVQVDNRGNITQRGEVNFAFNEADQITSVVNKNGYPNNPSFWSITQHGYDPNGHRVVSQFACGTTHSIYGVNGTLMWQAYDLQIPLAARAQTPPETRSCQTSPKHRKYVYLDRQNIAEVETKADNTTKISYRHNDALGSARAITDAAGQLVTTTHYGPFGEPVNGTQVRGTGYTGHQMDDDGLTYMGARYYDQMSGRFLSIDPVPVVPTSATNWNRYAYAANNPYRFTDPDGQNVFSVLDWYDFANDVGGLVVQQMVYGAAKIAGDEQVAMYAAEAMVERRFAAAASTLGVISPAPRSGQGIKAMAAGASAASTTGVAAVGRRGALGEAKRDLKIPRSQHPTGVEMVEMTNSSGKKVLGADGLPIMTREYTYIRPNGDKVIIQDHSAGHQFPDGGIEPGHFNVRPPEDRRHGVVDGTKPHYPFKD